MYDAIIVISQKDYLDWSRLLSLKDHNEPPQFLTVKKDGSISRECRDAPFIIIPEMLPDKIIRRHAKNFLENNNDASIFAAVHETCQNKLRKSLGMLKENGVQIHFFYHEDTDQLWSALDRFITCLEKKGNIQDALDSLLSLFPDLSINALRNDVLTPLAAAHLLSQASFSHDSKYEKLWRETAEKAQEILNGRRYQALCEQARCPELSDVLEELLSGITEQPPEIDENKFLRTAQQIALCLEDNHA